MTLLLRRILSRAKMLDFLVELEKTSCNEAWSLYLTPGLPHSEVENSLKEMTDQKGISPELAELASSSKNGAVFFRNPKGTILVLPPFPIVGKHLTHSLSTEQLHSLIRRDYMIALILVRLGVYAIGICNGENLVSHKVGKGLVHGRHKKGGSSQQRFQRHREKQIEYFLSRVCRHAQEQLKPHASTLDYLVYGGAWTTIKLLQKQCPFLGKLDTPTLPPLLDIPEPRQPVLETAVSRVWSSTVLEWREN